MITVCACPVPTMLPDIIEATPCYENFGQIQKLVFWRRGNAFKATASGEVQAVWTAALASTTDGKAVVSPFVSGASVVAGEARTYGGGNDTIDGIELILGSEASTFEAMVLRYDQDTIALLKELQCEVLDVIFINENGQFGYSDGGGSTFGGFPIEGLFVGDLNLPGYSEPNRNVIRFKLPSGWSNNFEISDATTFALTMTN